MWLGLPVLVNGHLARGEGNFRTAGSPVFWSTVPAGKPDPYSQAGAGCENESFLLAGILLTKIALSL